MENDAPSSTPFSSSLSGKLSKLRVSSMLATCGSIGAFCERMFTQSTPCVVEEGGNGAEKFGHLPSLPLPT